jgi:hypothetical protein
MRIVFAECSPRYDTHLAPYQIWGFLEAGETPATAFELGMLPGNPAWTRFYLARSIRVRLDEYVETAGVRRVGRKCIDLSYRLLPRPQVEIEDELVDMCRHYMNTSTAWASRRNSSFDAASVRARLDLPAATHLLTVTDRKTGRPVGLAAIHNGRPVAYYITAWYDQSYRSVYIGKYLKVAAIGESKHAGLSHIYLGTCYSEGALYKTEFAGVEFFDGIGWSSDRRKLRLMVREQHRLGGRHLFEHQAYLADHDPPDGSDATMRLAGIDPDRHSGRRP